MKKIYAVFIALISLLIVLPFGNVVSAATSSDGYVWPIDVSSARSVYTSDFFDAHPAIDIAASTGTQVVAAKGGTVFCASASSTSASHKCSRCGFTGAGYHVVIKQTDGKYAMYAHLSSVSVSTGASIATGKKLGAVGSTGISTGAHLHFGIYNPNSDGSINYYSYTEPLKVLTPFCNVYADNITNTSAVLHGQFGAISIPFASAGIYFGTSPDNMTKITDSEASGFEFAYNNIEGLYFETDKYCGTLQKGVTYYYRIWIVNSGKEYKSDIYRFTAGDKNSSAQVTDEETYSLSWTDNISEIYENNAKVGKICHLTGINNLSVSKVGIYLYDNSDNLLDSLTESTANAGFAGESVVYIWYDIKSELGYTLQSGTTYKYKLIAEINGKIHYSPAYSFTTTGCEHNYVYVGGTTATCTESGKSNYECNKCHATNTVITDASGHSFDTVYTVDKKATCLENGSKSLHCKRCSAKKNEVVINATGHDYDDGVITVSPTCGAAGVRTYTCSSCFDKKTEAISKTSTHTYTNSCDANCNVCGLVRAVTHSFKTSWENSKDGHWHECSVCGTSDGISAHTPGAAASATNAQLCTVCGYVINAALGHTHDYGNEWAVNASSHWHSCVGCDDRIDEEAHVYDNDCDTDCNVCKHTRGITHSFNTTWENDDGKHWHACAICGVSDEKLDHEYTNDSDNSCNTCGHIRSIETTEPNTSDNNQTTSPVTTENEKGENDKKNNATTVVVITAVAAVLAGAGIASAVFVIISKKRR